jgi:hypothetical protein
MPVLAEAAAQARVIARRGASAAAVVIGASFHPFRTVRGLVQPSEEPIPGPPTDAQEAPVATTPPPSAAARPAAKPQAGADIVPKPVEPPVPDGDTAEADRPVEARGPAPHIPPRIAGEIERDYGDELPGFTPGEG